MQDNTIYTLTPDEVESVLYYVYMHTSRTSGLSYIGVSMDIEYRKRGHNYEAHNPNCSTYNTHFKRAIRKYGIDDFDTKILWCTPCKGTAYRAEVYYIDLYDTFKGLGYNSTKGGESCSYWTNKHLPQEMKDKMSKAKLGTKASQKTKDKMSKIRKGKPIHTQESKNKIAKANIGKKVSQETRDRMSKAQTGKKQSQETIDKRAKALTGKTMSKKNIKLLIQRNSKNYIIIFPNKIKKKINNLSQFCREHNLNMSAMSSVASGKRQHHKQFKCYHCV